MQFNRGNRAVMVFNTLVNGVDLIATLLFSFLVIPILLSTLGEDMFGVYSLLLVFSATGFLSLLDFGFQGALMKFLAEFEAQNKYLTFSKYYWNGILMYLMVGFGLTLTFLVAINLFDFFPFKIPEELHSLSRKVFNIYVLQFPLQFLSIAFTATLSSVQRFLILKLINLFFLLSNFLFIYFLIDSPEDLYNYIVVFNLLFLGKCMFEFFFASKVIPREFRFKISFSIKTIKELAGYAKYLFISRVIGLINTQADKLIISFLLPISNLSSFNILNKIPNLMIAIGSVVNSTVMPMAARLNSKSDDERLKLLFLRATNLSLLLIMPLVIVCIFYVESFIGLWVGKEYVYLAPLSIILLVNLFFLQLINIGSTMMAGSGHVKKVIPYIVIGSIINLSVSLLLLPHYGLKGLVIGTLVSEAATSLPQLHMMMRLYKVELRSFINEVKYSFLSFFLFFFLCYFISDLVTSSGIFLLIIEVGILLLIYMIFAFFFVLPKHEKENVIRLFQKIKTSF